MWLLKQSDSSANLLNRQDSFQVKVKRRMKGGKRPRDFPTSPVARVSRKFSSSPPPYSNTSPSSSSPPPGTTRYKRHVVNPSLFSSSSNLHSASPHGGSPHSNASSSPSSQHYTNHLSPLTSNNSPTANGKSHAPSSPSAISHPGLSGHSSLHSESFISISASGANVQLHSDIAQILSEITTPIITVTFLQSSSPKSADSIHKLNQTRATPADSPLLISCLCQHRVYDYSTNGIQISLYEYSIHQTKVTLVLLSVEEFTNKKENARREANLMYISMLLSSVVVYNCRHSDSELISEHDLDFFLHLASLKHRFKETGHFLKPNLLWLTQGEQTMSTENSHDPSSSKLMQALTKISSSKHAKLKFAIKKSFAQHESFSLPTTQASYHHLLDPSAQHHQQFLDAVSGLRHHLSNPNNMKKVATSMENVKVNGKTWLNFAQALVHALNRDQPFVATKVSKEIMALDSSTLYDQIAQQYTRQLESMRQRLPMDHIELEEWNRSRTQEAVSKLRHTIEDNEHSDRILRQLLSQLEGSMLTDFYKLLRVNEKLCREHSQQVIERLYEKIRHRLDSYRSVQQFNKDVADMKSSFWHQSIGSEKQNIWIQFNGAMIQPDLLQLRRRLEDENSHARFTGSPAGLSNSPSNARGGNTYTRKRAASGVGTNRMTGLPGKDRMPNMFGGARSPSPSTPSYASATASSSKHTRTKFPRIHGS